MMFVFTSFVQGIRNVWANRFLIGIMFLFKFVFSLILLAPLYLMFSASFGANAKASRLLEGFDFSLLIDFIYHWRQTLSIYFLMSFLVFFLAVVVFVFLSGGFWGILRDQSKGEAGDSKLERFFGYCAKYFWGMFKIALLLILFYLIAFFLFLFFTALFDSVFGKGDWFEVSSWRTVIKILTFVFLFFLVNMIGDYLRIFYVQNFLDRLFASAKKAFRFLLTNLFRTLSLYYLLSLVLIVAVLAYVGVKELTEVVPKTGFYVLLVFLVQQVLSLFRAFYRLTYYSSQLVLTDKLLTEKEGLTRANSKPKP
jgi:hypothetical protein